MASALKPSRYAWLVVALLSVFLVLLIRPRTEKEILA